MPFVVLNVNVKSNIAGVRRQMRRIVKDALRVTGNYWHSNILRKHFTPGAKFGYRHQRREETTKEIKRALGENPELDLVQSGESQRSLRVDPRITATSNKATVRMTAPSHWKSRAPGEPDRADEVTRVSNADRKEMSKIMERMLASGIKLEQIRQGPQSA